MKQIHIKAWLQAAVYAAVAAVLIVIGGRFPLFCLVTFLFAGVLMMDIGTRFGLKVSVASAVLTILFVFMVTRNLQLSVQIGIIPVFPGVAMGYMASQKRGYTQTLTVGFAAMLFSLLQLVIVWNEGMGGDGIGNYIAETIQGAKQTLEPLREAIMQMDGIPTQGLQKAWDLVFEDIRMTVLLYIPAYLIGFSAAMAWLMLSLGIFWIGRVRRIRIPYRPFHKIYAPASMCYILCVFYLICTFSHDTSIWTLALKNLSELLFVYFAVCGLSVIDCKLAAKVPSGYARFGIYLAAFVIGYVMIILLWQGLYILGILDSVWDFRHLHHSDEERVEHE